MKIIQTPLEGFLVIEPDVYRDDRGFFLETYQEERYHQAGITDKFVQDNHSRSVKGVLRGMHFQIKKPQAQIVTVMQGEIFDAVVDIRKESKTFGKWYGVRLNANSQQRQVYMPPGFAHGFCVLSEYADLHYKVTELYNSSDEAGLLWRDLDLKIRWPIKKPILSKRDNAYPSLRDVKSILDKNFIK
jgi:dTDP-4-dehydrorhamnose 3,5-epimerase